MKIVSFIFKKDNLISGFIIGLFLPVVAFAAFYLINILIIRFFSLGHLLKDSSILLLAIASNMLALRYYLVKAKFERTGMSILFLTFIFGIGYFILVHGKNLQLF
ncbi:MAG: hypothetical protein ACOYMF_09045 [Bacteroidales bacterium]